MKRTKTKRPAPTPLCDAHVYMSPTGNLYVPLALARKLERKAA